MTPREFDATWIQIAGSGVLGSMPTFELVSLLIAVVVWIALLGTLAPER